MAKKRTVKTAAENSGAEALRTDSELLTAPSASEPLREDELHGPIGLDVGETITEDIPYIPPALRSLVERIDSLVLDDQNVKIHGDKDLPIHAASLREFGIQRAIVFHRESRKVLAGNGTVMAATLNGWTWVPAIPFDGTEQEARAFALADNAVGTLAEWDESQLAKITAEVDGYFTDDLLKSMAKDLEAELEAFESEVEEEPAEEDAGEQKLSSETKPEDVILEHRVIATCKDQDAQIKLLAELSNRGHECKLSTIRVH